MIKNKKKFFLINILLLILSLISVILFVFYIFKYFIFGANYFLVKKINIHVHNNILSEVQQVKINRIVNKNLTGNILNINAGKVKSSIEDMQWVERVNIKRIWPFTIEIFIKEKEPIARWGNCCLIDNKGEIFKFNTDKILPIFEVSKNIQYKDNIKNMMIEVFNQINNELEKSNIYIYKLILSNSLSFSILLDNGLLIKLGRFPVVDKVQMFIKAWDLFLKEEQNRIKYIDIRYDDGLSVLYKNLN